MSYTIEIKETNLGYVTFASEEEAKEWMEEPDFTMVKWYDCLESDFYHEGVRLNT